MEFFGHIPLWVHLAKIPSHKEIIPCLARLAPKKFRDKYSVCHSLSHCICLTLSIYILILYLHNAET